MMIEPHVDDQRRLLVVADDLASAEALRTHLSRHGFSVARATSARAAARAAREIAPEVVLVDAAVRGGWRDVVLALDGLVERGRVAVLAAYWSAEAQAAAREFGIGETLLKQLEGPALAGRLRRLADRPPEVLQESGVEDVRTGRRRHRWRTSSERRGSDRRSRSTERPGGSASTLERPDLPRSAPTDGSRS